LAVSGVLTGDPDSLDVSTVDAGIRVGFSSLAGTLTEFFAPNAAAATAAAVNAVAVIAPMANWCFLAQPIAVWTVPVTARLAISKGLVTAEAKVGAGFATTDFSLRVVVGGIFVALDLTIPEFGLTESIFFPLF